MAETKAPNSDEICQDAEALRDKQKVMNKQWYNSLFYSLSDTLKTIASVLTPVGIGAILPTIIEKAGTEGVMGALQAAPTTNLIIAAVSLSATVLAIGVSYLSSHYYHSANFDQTEVNSQHTAKYIVRELKKQNVQEQEHAENCRADGQPWVKVIRIQTTATPEQSRAQG